MLIEHISPGNLCGREAQVPGRRSEFFCEWAPEASRVKFRDMVDTLTLGDRGSRTHLFGGGNPSGVQSFNLSPGRFKNTGIFAVSGLRTAGRSAPPHV
jgi:hypothetical protein